VKRPIARPTATGDAPEIEIREPRAFAANRVTALETVEPGFEPETLPETLPNPKGMGWLGRLAWGTGEVGAAAVDSLQFADDRLGAALVIADYGFGGAVA
jgi:hypothetical protein